MVKKPASLSASLIAKKGEARPSVVVPQVDVGGAVSEPAPALVHHHEPAAVEVEHEAAPVERRDDKKRDYHKSLTVKLDRSRFVELKAMGAELDLSSQEIFVQALDDWFAKHRPQ